MAKSEPDRHWQFQHSDFNFDHRFFRGITFDIARHVFHFNPGIPIAFLKYAPDVILVSGAWGLPTNIFTTLLATTFHDSAVLLWSESHLESRRWKGWIAEGLRALLLRLYDGFVVPGKLAAEYVTHYLPDKALYYLPNTMDERIFRDEVLKLRSLKEEIRSDLGVPKGRRVLFLSARLAPEKGIIPLLTGISCLPQSVAERFTLLIAGDGPLRAEIEAWTRQHPGVDVRLMGYVEKDALVKAYAFADSFLLPSLSDPNPLSVIEALWAGLPLVLSNRVGNHPEALSLGVNGWLFDPISKTSVCTVLTEWASVSDGELRRRGSASRAMAQEKFRTDLVVQEFVGSIFSGNQAKRFS